MLYTALYRVKFPESNVPAICVRLIDSCVKTISFDYDMPSKKKITVLPTPSSDIVIIICNES